MSSDLAIRVEGLGKSYVLRHQQSDHVTLSQVALERARHPFRRNESEQFWALHDVSFEVRPGEVLGVIGRNGAGKSTLLKLLTRITGPTAGRIDLWGRVGSLLEVGTGFHPELTGRENVYLNGAILGMSRAEIDKQFDAIVAFAGVEKFLDTPVKRYSSGMYVRLAFAVAAHLETEILLVDEVLAVGDQDFQQRCLGKMHDVAADGRTVLFVSHQLQSITSLCDQAIRLESGGLHSSGPAAAMVSAYLGDLGRQDLAVETRSRGNGEWRLGSVTDLAGPLRVGQPARIRISADQVEPTPISIFPSITVTAMTNGEVVAHCDARRVGAEVSTSSLTGCAWDFDLRSPWLKPGDYAVSVHLCTVGGVLDQLDPALVLTVLPEVESAEVKTLEFNNLTETVADFSLSVSTTGDGPASG